MKGVFLPGNRRVEFRAIAVPQPGPGEVLIAVKASCICRSDLNRYHGNANIGGATPGTWVSGHEPAGVIVSVGPRVHQVAPGDRVAIHLGIGCGMCAACRMGNTHRCRTWKCPGATMHGGNAEYIVVPERNCLRIPASMSFVAAAISTDAFGTPFSAAKKLWINSASTVGIWALGPMGSSGVFVGKALGARVVALDPIEGRRNFAMELGADLGLDPNRSGSA